MSRPLPSWWPAGACEFQARECARFGCEYCGLLIRKLDDYRRGVAPDGENRALAAFAGGDD